LFPRPRVRISFYFHLKLAIGVGQPWLQIVFRAARRPGARIDVIDDGAPNLNHIVVNHGLNVTSRNEHGGDYGREKPVLHRMSPSILVKVKWKSVWPSLVFEI
jgi:hypothetical protein